MIGQTLGHYRIEAKLGEGGMGVVYKARDSRLGRSVAIKVLSSETVSNPDRKRRFVHEAKAASALNHAHIVTIYEIGTEGEIDFIAMEYVSGQTLDRLIGPRGIPLPLALDYAVQISDALSTAHEVDYRPRLEARQCHDHRATRSETARFRARQAHRATHERIRGY